MKGENQMKKSRIDWCDSTWNPVTGCLHGCEYCYARRIATRFGGSIDTCPDDGLHELEEPFYSDSIFNPDADRFRPYPYMFDPTFHRYRLEEPKRWTKNRNIFVCSMADLFGEWVPDEWIREVFIHCDAAAQHNYMFLTKNPKRYVDLAEKGLLPEKHWFGYSVTRQSDLWEFEHADECPVKNLFVSIEPILEPLQPAFCSHCPADWVIIGAETGNRKGKVIPPRKWIEEIVKICDYSGIPLFMKSSLAGIWGEPLIQQFPDQLSKKKGGTE